MQIFFSPDAKKRKKSISQVPLCGHAEDAAGRVREDARHGDRRSQSDHLGWLSFKRTLKADAEEEETAENEEPVGNKRIEKGVAGESDLEKETGV